MLCMKPKVSIKCRKWKKQGHNATTIMRSKPTWAEKWVVLLAIPILTAAQWHHCRDSKMSRKPILFRMRHSRDTT